MSDRQNAATFRGAYRDLREADRGRIQSAIQAPFLAFLVSINNDLEAALENEREKTEAASERSEQIDDWSEVVDRDC